MDQLIKIFHEIDNTRKEVESKKSFKPNEASKSRIEVAQGNIKALEQKNEHLQKHVQSLDGTSAELGTQ